MMNKTFLLFPAILVFILLIAFGVQILIHSYLDIDLFGGFIITNYLFNLSITLISFIVIQKLREQKSKQLGFIFLASSMLKFILFLIFIRPQYELINGIKSLEFATFFVPYAISTSIEVIYLIKILKQ